MVLKCFAECLQDYLLIILRNGGVLFDQSVQIINSAQLQLERVWTEEHANKWGQWITFQNDSKDRPSYAPLETISDRNNNTTNTIYDDMSAKLAGYQRAIYGVEIILRTDCIITIIPQST